MQQIQVLERHFEMLIPGEKIREQVQKLALELRRDYLGKDPLFIAVLNGAFVFAGDLFKELNLECAISFIKVASYKGVESSGEMEVLLGLKEEIRGRHVVILEDIIDTGLTLEYMQKIIAEKEPASLAICALLQKPTLLKADIQPRYVGFKVENRFLVGYGLDYNGYGRNSPHVYAEIQK